MCCLSNHFTDYDKILSAFSLMIEENLKSQVKLHFFSIRDSISIIRFLVTSVEPENSNRIPGKAAMWGSTFFVRNAFATKINNRIFAATNIPYKIISENTVEPTIQRKFLL